MDISKLPKLSKTGESQPDPTTGAIPTAERSGPAAPPPFPPVYFPPTANSIGLAEAWISIGLGILLLFIFPNTISYLHSPTDFAKTVTNTDAQGNVISYAKSAFFWTDLGVTIFAVALILEGVAMAALRKLTLLWLAFAVTVFAALFNAIVIACVYPHQMDFPLVCGLGVIILGYMAMTQWRLISILRK